MKILMGKKLKLVIFGLLLVAAIGFLVSQPNSAKYDTAMLTTKSGSALRSTPVSKLINKDSDKDGLKDWEEELWGTDLNNSDTDGDGIDDGDEVDDNRNPNLAGPDDELDRGFVAQEKDDEDLLKEDLTATDLFAQNLFGEYLSLRGSGQQISDTEKSSLVTSVVENTLNTGLNKRYAISDLNIVNDNSAAALKKYGNDFISITQLYSQDLTEDELIVFERMLRTESAEDAAYLNESAAAYDAAADKLKSIKIPSDLSFIHLDIINSYSVASDALKDMGSALDDPIRGLNGFSVHTAATEAQIGFFKEIKNYFVKNGIVFGADEAGYIWNTI